MNITPSTEQGLPVGAAEPKLPPSVAASVLNERDMSLPELKYQQEVAILEKADLDIQVCCECRGSQYLTYASINRQRF
jgi:hypothetical protein